ncbi:hypothetical protein NQ317_004390 [Molorchus minor]|uniref:Uncharacterized protein n=1 Tax=Molorchus minor TaxID=1323400 RepID=A0ABQ9IYJ0_9CUCU|nr:hypothetical protein NQ317_004390 [Molorchus minor]
MSKFLYDIKEESESSLSLESLSTQATACDPTYLISIIGDEDTCVGYLLGGIGEVDDEEQPNYFIVDQNTKDLDVELAIKRFVRRGDIGIILITKDAAEKVPNMLHAFEYNKALPMVIKIPGKNGPYDVNVDQYLRKLKEINGCGENVGKISSIQAETRLPAEKSRVEEDDIQKSSRKGRGDKYVVYVGDSNTAPGIGGGLYEIRREGLSLNPGRPTTQRSSRVTAATDESVLGCLENLTTLAKQNEISVESVRISGI